MSFPTEHETSPLSTTHGSRDNHTSETHRSYCSPNVSPCGSPQHSIEKRALTTESVVIPDTRTDSRHSFGIDENSQPVQQPLQRDVSPAPAGRSSVDALLDRLEGAPNCPSATITTEDSLLLNFDPLVEKYAAAFQSSVHYEHIPPNPVHPTEEDRFFQTPEKQLHTLLTTKKVVDLSSDFSAPRSATTTKKIIDLSSTSSAPRSEVRPHELGQTASPAVFSPWMHHSILDQALGGSDHSPEWHISLPTTNLPKRASKSLTSAKSPLPPRSTEHSHLGDVLSEPSVTRSSIPPPADSDELDALTTLLERVHVQDTPVLRSDKVKADESGQITALSSQPISTFHDDTQCTPATKVAAAGSGTFKVERKTNRTVDASSVQWPSFGSATPSPPPARSRDEPTESRTPHYVEYAPVDPGVSGKSKLEISSRLSLGSISGMVSQVARSIYDRLGSASGFTMTTRTPTQPDPENTDSPITRQSLHILEETEPTRPKVSTTDLSSSFGLKSAHVAQPPTSTCSSFAQSADEDVWESVESINDPKPGTFSKSRSVLDQTIDIVSENKENLEFFPTTTEALASGAHEQWTIGTHTESEALASNVANVSRTDRGSLHESQLTYNVTPSSCNRSRLQNSKLSDQQADIAQEWMDLQDEVSRLRSTADNLSELMLAYERTLLDADTYLHKRNSNAVARMTQLAQERDDAIEQVTNMYKACEYMVRGIQRAKENIEMKKEKQAAAVRLLEKLENKHPKMVAKTQKIIEHFATQLGEALDENQKQQETDLRKLDKLRFDLRQAELREVAITEQIKQLDQQSGELTKICQTFFP